MRDYLMLEEKYPDDILEWLLNDVLLLEDNLGLDFLLLFLLNNSEVFVLFLLLLLLDSDLFGGT